MNGIEAFIAAWGYWAVFLGTFVEGETILSVAGFAAHQRLLSPVGVWAAATLGALSADQLVFHLARRNRTHPRVLRALSSGVGRAAMDTVVRHPDRFALMFRFLFGFRIVGPVVIALAGMRPGRFLACNAAAAVVWAALWTGVGFLFGHAVVRVLGELRHAEHRAGAALLLAAVVAGIVWTMRRRAGRRRAA